MAQVTHETELYLFGSRSGKHLLDSDVLFHTFHQQKPTAKDEISCHRNFIYFCGAAQALELDFLPISWQPQSGLIGRGGTSNIHQSVLNLELGLAFKAIDVGDISRTPTTEDQENVYSLLLAEIQMMGRKPILDSPYIHRVDGVCWNPNKRTGAVDPVLVFEKSHHGDMYRFLTSGQGKSLDLSGRIKMCRDVAKGLETLHACKIVHGDVKPQNVLLKDFEDGSIVPQVADFGYSTIYTNSDSTMTVSRTAPWNAPEVEKQKNGYVPTDAIRTDIFSFGMLCLWVLFRGEVANQFGTTLDFTDDREFPESNSGSLFKTITSLKDQDRLRHFCQSLIRSLSWEPSQKENLTKLFELTLSPLPLDRVGSFRTLWEYLNSCLTDQASNQAEPEVSFISENAAQGQHYDFVISESMIQLVGVDIRVREQIAKSLLDQAQNAACSKCQSNAAFQVSICLTIGFGIPANDDSAQEWLRRSGRSQVDLNQQLDRMSQWTQALEPYLYHTAYMNNLSNEGYLRSHYFDAYQSEYSFDTIKQSYQREITDFAAKLRPESILLISLKIVYTGFLRNAGHYREALSIQERCLHHHQSDPALNGNFLNTQILMNELAKTHQLQGNFELASRYCEEVKISRIEHFGHRHPLTLDCLHLEATLLQEIGSYEEAEKLYRTLIFQRQSILGKYHRDTLSAMGDLGSLFMVLGRYDEALISADEQLQLSEQLLGPNHYNTLTSLNNLAVVHFEKGDTSKAQSLLDLAIFRLRLAFGDNHPSISKVLISYASLYLLSGNHKESISCYNEALLRLEKQLGPDHPSTLEVVLAKADFLVEVDGDFEETNELFQRCIQTGEKILGEYHPDVLGSLTQYSSFLLQRDKLDEAERSYRSLLLRQESRFGSPHVALIETLSQLGNVLSLLKREDADEMYRRAVRLANEIDGGQEVFSWACMRNLALYLQEKGIHMDEVEILYQRIVDSKRACSSEQTIDISQALKDLTEVFIDQGKFEEAEKTLRELIEISQTLSNIDDADRLGALANLAHILTKREKFFEAEPVYLECITLSTSAIGEDGEGTLDLSARLALNMEREGKSQEARLRVLGALRKAKERYGALHPVYLRVGSITASIYFRQGDQAKAIDLSHEVVKGCYLVFGAKSEEVQIAEANHGLYTKEDGLRVSGKLKATETSVTGNFRSADLGKEDP